MTFGGHSGGSTPPPVEPKTPAPVAEDPAAAKERSDAEARAKTFAKKRRGQRSTRLTDPIVELGARQDAQNPSTTDRPKRVSLMGGGEY